MNSPIQTTAARNRYCPLGRIALSCGEFRFSYRLGPRSLLNLSSAPPICRSVTVNFPALLRTFHLRNAGCEPNNNAAGGAFWRRVFNGREVVAALSREEIARRRQYMRISDGTF